MQPVLFITDSLVAGGIEAQLVELATRLDRQRFAPMVVCLYGPPVREAYFLPRLQDAGIPTHFLNLDLLVGAKLIAVRRIAAAIQVRRPAVVQAENYHANLLTRLTRVVCAPLLPRFALVGTVRGVLSSKQLFYERLSQRFCEVIVINAPQLRPMLVRQSGIAAAKIETIPNGIDLRRFAPDHDDSLQYPHARRVFLVIGRISAEKNIHLTVQAFGVLKRRGSLPPDVRLLIVGPVQEAEAQALIEQAVQADGLQGTVIQHGATLRPEDTYRGCDVCIVFSSPRRPPAEGLPSVILEAMAARRPVIASDIANAAGVIESEVSGWIAPAQNVEALARCIQAAIDTPDDTLRQMGAAAVKQAQPYAVELMVGRYQALYERLTAQQLP